MSGAAGSGESHEGRKVLVVDDNFELADNIAEVLSLSGYETVVANSAEEALPLALTGDVCFVVTDFRLPGRTGAELIRGLRLQGWKTPAAVMSAYTDEGTIATARSAGIAEFIPKPIDFHRLAEVIGSAAA
jgi:CheY-like chemotaxis protein